MRMTAYAPIAALLLAAVLALAPARLLAQETNFTLIQEQLNALEARIADCEKGLDDVDAFMEEIFPEYRLPDGSWPTSMPIVVKNTIYGSGRWEQLMFNKEFLETCIRNAKIEQRELKERIYEALGTSSVDEIAPAPKIPAPRAPKPTRAQWLPLKARVLDMQGRINLLEAARKNRTAFLNNATTTDRGR